MKPLAFTTITNLEDAQKIWEHFSPNQTIDDEWNFRYTFYKYLELPLRFIVGYDGNTPVGLLPLQFNTNQGMSTIRYGMTDPFLEFFGGVDMDDNKIFLKPGYEHRIPEFLGQIDSLAVLAPLAESYAYQKTAAVHYTDKFVVDIKNVKSLEAFIDEHFQGKSRRRIKNRLNYFNKNYNIKIKKGTDIDLELMFSLNIDRFQERSAFNMEHRKQIFRDLVKLYKSDLFTIFMDGEPKAVSLSLVHKGIYSGLNSGYDYAVRDLGKYVFLTKIRQAIKLGNDQFDAGKNDNGWKEHFHLNKIPQYKLTLNMPHAELQVPLNMQTL